MEPVRNVVSSNIVIANTLDKLKEQTKLKLTRHYLKNPPKTDDELHDFIRYVLGFNIPRKAHPAFPHHNSPFEGIADYYFERVPTAVLFANRTGGKTLNSGILNVCNFIFKPGCESVHAGAVRDQANKAYQYFADFMEKNPALLETVKGGEIFKTQADGNNGAKLHIITASARGLRGQHPHKAILDEVDEMSWDLLQTGASMARSTDTIKGQNLYTSTRNKAHGTMDRLLTEADVRRISVYEWNVWSIVEKCTRECEGDLQFGDCPALTRYCKGKAHESDGYYPIEDLIQKILEHDEIRWRTEWENELPSGDILVYGDIFNRRVHVIDDFPIPDNWHVFSGIDFGSSPGHPFVYLKLAMSSDGYWFLFHEYYAGIDLLRNHAERIKRSPFYKPGENIVADHDAQDRLELSRGYGITTKPAYKDIRMGIDVVREKLTLSPEGKPRLYIMKSCVNTVREFESYAWPRYEDGKVNKTDKPLKLNDHTCFDDKTEVLTNEGWKLFKDLSKNELIATMAENWQLEWQKPTAYQEFDYNGEMYNYSGQLDFSVTPDHKMLVVSQYNAKMGKNNKFERVPIKDLTSATYWVPKICVPEEKQPLNKIDPYFLGFYLAEGCKSISRGRKYVHVDQKDLDVLNFAVSKLPYNIPRPSIAKRSGVARISIRSDELYDILPDGKADSKRIPRWFLENANQEELELCFQGMMDGDGSVKSGNNHYNTISIGLANDFCELLVRIGKNGKITKLYDERETFIFRKLYTCKPCYRITIRKEESKVLGKYSLLEKDKIIITTYSGTVYCVTVPNHTVCVRRNGRIMWSGQCDVVRYVIASHERQPKPSYKFKQAYF